MHTLGKVFLGLVALLTILAIALTNGLLGARGEWLKRVNSAKHRWQIRPNSFATRASP